MQLQKKTLGKDGFVLKNLLKECKAQDKNDEGCLDFDGFELALKRQG